MRVHGVGFYPARYVSTHIDHDEFTSVVVSEKLAVKSMAEILPEGNSVLIFESWSSFRKFTRTHPEGLGLVGSVSLVCSDPDTLLGYGVPVFDADLGLDGAWLPRSLGTSSEFTLWLKGLTEDPPSEAMWSRWSQAPPRKGSSTEVRFLLQSILPKHTSALLSATHLTVQYSLGFLTEKDWKALSKKLPTPLVKELSQSFLKSPDVSRWAYAYWDWKKNGVAPTPDVEMDCAWADSVLDGGPHHPKTDEPFLSGKKNRTRFHRVPNKP